MPKYQVNTPIKYNGQLVIDGPIDMPADEAVDLLARGLISPAPAASVSKPVADATPPRGRRNASRTVGGRR